MPMEEQVVSIFAGVNGFLDTVPVKEVVRFESSLLAHVRNDHPQVLATLREHEDAGRRHGGKPQVAHRRFREELCIRANVAPAKAGASGQDRTFSSRDASLAGMTNRK
jgi:F0F1-type ATP synthase alpha subunit